MHISATTSAAQAALRSPYAWQVGAGLVLLGLYLLLLCWTTSNYIRTTNRRWLRAHTDALRGRLAVEDADVAEVARHRQVRQAIDGLLDAIAADDPGGRSGTLHLRSWIGSREIGHWVRLHEAQRLEVWRLPDEAVLARFARAMGQIDELPVVRQSAWQRRWVQLQGASGGGGRSPASADVWRAELSQLLAELFNARDATYSQLVSLYGKAGWLVFVAFLPVLGLLVAGYGLVLLAGFLGGLISRMQRIAYAHKRPTAYGTSWIPLFLGPLLGALAAWAGLHMLALLQVLGIVDMAGVLGSGAQFRLTPSTGTLGLAVVLGFSERFLNRIGTQAETIVGAQEPTSAAASGNPAASADDVLHLPDTPTVAANSRA